MYPLVNCQINMRVGLYFAAALRDNVQYRNTGAAYVFAAVRLPDWCEARGNILARLTRVIVAAYIEELGQHLDKPSVKRHLAALGMRSITWSLGRSCP